VNALIQPGTAPSLPGLSEAAIERIQQETDDTIARLLREGRLAANTRRSYRSALRYWSAWHIASFGLALPLANTPPAAVPPATVRAFIAHHAPTVRGGVVQPSMPDDVRQRLAQLMPLRRQVCQRGDAAEDAVAIGTMKQRVSALNAMHGLLGLQGPLGVDPTLQGLLRAAHNVASTDAPETLRLPKREVTREILDALLARCDEDDTPEGIRDAAIIAAGFYGGGRRRSELASMRWSHLTPFEDRLRGLAGWVWDIPAVKGKRRERADEGAMRTLLVEDAAHRLDRWRDWCVLQQGGELQGAVWRRLRILRDGWSLKAAMDAEDIAERIKVRIAQIGLDPDHYAGHSLRSGAVTTLLAEGGDLSDAARMAGHTSLETTRRYYDRRTVAIEGIAALVKKPR
jgi:integrase